MKILVFEYICGGGFAGQVLPASLAAEGGMMLQALVAELKHLPDVQLLVALDKRCSGLILPIGVEIAWVDGHQSVLSLLPVLIDNCDAVWPIAPETDGILATIAVTIRARNKILLLSSVEAVALCGDKWATYQHLLGYGLPLIDTCLLSDFTPADSGPWVLKPRDGVGCQGGMIVEDIGALVAFGNNSKNSAQTIIQPYCIGQAVSLSCLFKQGNAWLICCNQQQMEITTHGFELRACVVNAVNLRRDFYRQLVERIALALPDLWGYIGIDLIETPAYGPLLLEINPRLTTSYVGILPATGINVAEQVLALINSDPDLQQSCDRSVTISIG